MARRKKLQVEEKKERRLPTTRYNPEYKKGTDKSASSGTPAARLDEQGG